MSKLPILMYHHISPRESVGLTISVQKLEAQFAYLAAQNYQTHHFGDLKSQSSLPPGQHLVITFDDAYVSQLELAYPLLKKYGLKATFFVPFQYVGATDLWNTSRLPILEVAQLKDLDPDIVALGFHSYAHQRYDSLSLEAIVKDNQQCLQFVEEKGLDMAAVLAYPYGKFPKEPGKKSAFFNQLAQDGIGYGLRIGNRINSFPFEKPYEIQRIDVRGEYSMRTFRWKLRYGRLL